MRLKHTLLAAALLAAGAAHAQNFTEDFTGETIGSLQAAGWSFTNVPTGAPGGANILSGDLVLTGASTATFNFTVTNTTPFYLVSFFASKALGGDTNFLDVTFRRTDAAGLNLTQRFNPLPAPGFLEMGGADPFGTRFSWHFGSPVVAGNYALTFANGGGSLIPFNTSTINLDTLSITAVPEPSTYALMLAGLGVVGWMARNRRKAGKGSAQGDLPMGALPA